MYASYVSGNEQHSSSWGKFYVKGLEKFVVKEDHVSNRHDNHHNYQCWEGEVPMGTVFTVFEQDGDKHGTDTFKFTILQAVEDGDEQHIRASYGSGEMSGHWIVLASADTKTKAPRLMDWWQKKPANVDAAIWAKHLAQYIDKRGVKNVPEMAAA